MTVIAAYVLFASNEEAERIARLLVEERLAACVNILAPCRSVYRWQGAVEQASEVPAIVKSDTALVDALIERVAELHSYAVPAITIWPIERALPAYAEWVGKSVQVE